MMLPVFARPDVSDCRTANTESTPKRPHLGALCDEGTNLRNILGREFPSGAALKAHVPRVIGWRPNKQMARTNTTRVVTMMENPLRILKRISEEEHGYSMGKLWTPLVFQASIALGIN